MGRTSGAVWAVIALAAAGCATCPEPAPQTADDTTEADEAESEARIMLNLEQAALPDVAVLLGQITGEPVVIAASLDTTAPCVTVSIYNPEPLDPERAVRQVRLALGQSGVELADTPDGLVFRPNGGPLPDCSAQAEARPAPSSPAAAPAPAAADRHAEQAALLDRLRAGIRQVSPTELEVTRAEMDDLRDHIELAFETLRLIPHEDGGHVLGIKLYGIRRESVPGVLGLQNGDMATTVNGRDVTTVDGAMEASTALSHADVIELAIVRRGTPVTLRYRVVPSLGAGSP